MNSILTFRWLTAEKRDTTERQVKYHKIVNTQKVKTLKNINLAVIERLIFPTNT